MLGWGIAIAWLVTVISDSVEVAPVFQPGPLFLMLLGVVSMLGRVKKPRRV